MGCSVVKGLIAGLALTGWVFLSCPQANESSSVQIIGLQSVSQQEAEEWIATQLVFVKSAGVSRARADDLSYFLENALRERGYKNATVDWELPENSSTILLKVQEGTSTQLGSILITGNEHLEDAAVIELLTSITRKRLKLDDSASMPYVASDLEKGKGLLVGFYQQMGFAAVQVDFTKTPMDGGQDVEVLIQEGPMHRTGAVTFPEAPTEQLKEAYASISQDFTGNIYSDIVAAGIRTRLRAAAVSSGYYNANVTVEPLPPVVGEGGHTVPMTVEADWGPLVEVSALKVTGNAKVSDEFFERQFDGFRGQTYSPQKTNERVNELLKTGTFETVRTDIVEQTDGTYSLDVTVEESHTRTLGVYGGFATYEGALVGFEFRHLNVSGMVRQLNSAVEYSKRGARGEITYSDPWFLSSGFEFRTSLFAVNRIEEGYEKFNTGGRYEFNRRFGFQKRNSIAFFGEAGYTDVHKFKIEKQYLGDPHYFSHQVGVSLTHDRRDRPNAPRKGFIAQGSVSMAADALGSEVEFLKATGRLGYYIPVGEHTLRLAARAGYVSSFGNDPPVPIDLRFYNGGAQSVRSFAERELGPKDKNGYPIGGEFYTTFNIEYEIPVQAVPGLSMVPFADAGNLFYDAEDASWDDLRYAIGLGLRYQTPIGPLRAEYGYNPDRQAGEAQGAFHLGFGFSF